MKYLINLFLIICVVSCEAPIAEGGSNIQIKYKYANGCEGHTITIISMPFEDNGHNMFLYTTVGQLPISVVHDPNCPKCTSVEKVESPIESASSDYWGW